MKRVIRSTTDIYGMARVGFLDNNLEIYVNTNDSGKIPHFHMRDPKDWTKFHACIKIYAPEYFNHGNKVSILNTKQKQLLDRFMKSPVTLSRYTDRFRNNWELVCFMWEMNNSDVAISENIIQPDYTKI